MAGTIIGGLIAIALGVGGAYGVFWLGNFLVDRTLGETTARAERVRGLVFVTPAMFVVGLFLVYPLFDTFRQTFYQNKPTSRNAPLEFVGFENYADILTTDVFRTALWNNILWMIFVPAGAVAIGLSSAVLADRLSPKWEKLSKSMIFLPMAISFVGASVVWDLVYDIETTGAQTGILNAIVVNVFGGEPIAWLERVAFNDFAMMVVMIWLQSGFAMVLLSAAIKSVPQDTIEAARIDGATEVQIFWRVTVPQIKSTIVVVTTTILILVLKVFDIVRVLGRSGQFNTDVIANAFYTQFEQGNRANAGVYVVVLVILTIPFMILNIRRFREQEASR